MNQLNRISTQTDSVLARSVRQLDTYRYRPKYISDIRYLVLAVVANTDTPIVVTSDSQRM
jgi:hypothetical protein